MRSGSTSRCKADLDSNALQHALWIRSTYGSQSGSHFVEKFPYKFFLSFLFLFSCTSYDILVANIWVFTSTVRCFLSLSRHVSFIITLRVDIPVLGVPDNPPPPARLCSEGSPWQPPTPLSSDWYEGERVSSVSADGLVHPLPRISYWKAGLALVILRSLQLKKNRIPVLYFSFSRVKSNPMFWIRICKDQKLFWPAVELCSGSGSRREMEICPFSTRTYS